MSTFLQLVNDSRRECGAANSGVALATLGGTLSHEAARFKQWVVDAWVDIQRVKRTWQFMEREFSFNTTAGVQGYKSSDAAVALTSFANWKRNTLRAYLTATGVPDEQLLGFVDYPTFRNLYMFGNMATTRQRPVVYSIDPDKQIVLGPVPDAVYTIRGWYYKAPQTLAIDADLPLVDEEFHRLIVCKVMEKYGWWESAPEVLRRGELEGGRLMSQLEMDYLPKITFGATLA